MITSRIRIRCVECNQILFDSTEEITPNAMLSLEVPPCATCIQQAERKAEERGYYTCKQDLKDQDPALFPGPILDTTRKDEM